MLARMSRYIHVSLMLLLGITWGCIDQVDLAIDEEAYRSQLVIDGSITLGKGPYTVSLRQTADFERDSTIEVVNATITLMDDQGNNENFLHIGKGIYELQGQNIQGREGHAYHIEISWNGELYQSQPETMPTAVEVMQINTQLGIEATLTEADVVVENDVIEISVDTELPPDIKGPYIRWEIEETYNLVEFPQPPFFAFKVCYFTFPLNTQDVILLDGSHVPVGVWENQFLASREIDWTFGGRHYFTVYQVAMTEEAFAYWQDVQRVIEQVGSIFDAPPAAVRGNVSNIDDPSEIVLGYFGAMAVDTARIFTTAEDFPIGIFNQLCPQLNIVGPPDDPACYNCFMLDGANPVRPDFF